MKYLLSIFLFMIISCSNIEQVNQSLEIMDKLVSNIEENKLVIYSSYIDEIKSFKSVIDSNFQAQLEIIRQEKESMEKDEIITEMSQVIDNYKRQMNILEKKILDTEKILKLDNKNYEDYKMISSELRDFINSVSSADTEKILKKFDEVKNGN